MKNKDIMLKLIRDNKIYTEDEIKEFESSIEGVPMRTYTQWISKGYEVLDNAIGYDTTIWVRRNKEGGSYNFIKKNVKVYSGKQVYKVKDDDDFDTGIWRDVENPDEEFESIGRDR